MCAADSASPDSLPAADELSLRHCQYSAWYLQYRRFAFSSAVIDLPPDFVDYLREDGIVVKDSSRALPGRARIGPVYGEDDYKPDFSSSSSDDEGAVDEAVQQRPRSDVSSSSCSSDSDSSEASELVDWTVRFPQLHAAIESAIQQLGGSVAPKLNWSTPTDALWINSNSLMCTNAEQVVLLLKSSERTAHDLELLQCMAHIPTAAPASTSAGPDPPSARPTPPPPQPPPPASVQLVLRRWHDLRPEREFRLFVCGHVPVAVSQRDPSQHFPQLADGAEGYRDAVCDFHARTVGSSFPLASYALDVYIATNGTVKLVDFNAIVDTTGSLLFEWDELPYHRQQQQQQQPAPGGPGPAAAPGRAPEGGDAALVAAAGAPERGWRDVPLRIVTHAGMVQPGPRNACGMPFDMLHLQESMGDILRMMQEQARAQRQEQ